MSGGDESGPDAANRGAPASKEDGAAAGSGAGAGGGGTPEDYDSDPQSGGGKVQQRHDKPSPAARHSF